MKILFNNTFPVLLICLLFATGCGEENSTGNTNKNEAAAPHSHPTAENGDVFLTAGQAALADIKTGAIETRMLGDMVRVNGYIDVPPDHLVSVSTPYGGTVKSTSLLEGTEVKKGQVLAVLQNPEFLQMQQQYLEARSQLEFLKAEYERKEMLYKEEVASQKSFQAAKAEFNAQQARVNSLAEQLKLVGYSPGQVRSGNISSSVAIRSGIDGVVKAVHVNVGRFVQPMEVLFELIDPRHQHVELTVYQKDASQIKAGQRVYFSVAGETEMNRKATVYLVGKALGNEKSLRVHAHPENKTDSSLRPGAYVQAVIETGSKSVLSVPNQAIVEFDGQDYLFVQKSKAQPERSQAFTMVPVQKGLSENGFTEVKFIQGQPLDTTARVVIEGAYALLGKLKVSGDEGDH